MERVPELIPISDMRQRQVEILGLLASGPVVLTQHGRAAAVMLSPNEYNRLIEALEDFQDVADAAAARQEPGERDFDDYVAERDRVPA